MTRRPRNDVRGSWHHVLNRGIARRTLFESVDDIRFFTSQLAHAVRRGELRIHAWCVVTTHCHLLVESPDGALSAAMQRIQNEYVRRFNRGRRRDGPLVRGRFWSKRVETLAYRQMLVRHIDANPVGAGLCRVPCEYLHGSARQYASREKPLWLERTWVEREVIRASRLDVYEPGQYARAFPARNVAGIGRVVEARAARSQHDLDPHDDLIAAAPPSVLSWMQRKSALADGTRPGIPLVDPCSARNSVRESRHRSGEWRLASSRKHVDGWKVVEVGLLHDLAGCGVAEIARSLAESQTTVRRLLERHAVSMSCDSCYGNRAARMARRALDACHR